jgi:chaperonin cofactor prefoldin
VVAARRFLFDRSQVKLDLQDWHGAVDDMTSALERLPDAASLHYSRGMALYTMRDDVNALRVSSHDL